MPLVELSQPEAASYATSIIFEVGVLLGASAVVILPYVFSQVAKEAQSRKCQLHPSPYSVPPARGSVPPAPSSQLPQTVSLVTADTPTPLAQPAPPNLSKLPQVRTHRHPRPQPLPLGPTRAITKRKTRSKRSRQSLRSRSIKRKRNHHPWNRIPVRVLLPCLALSAEIYEGSWFIAQKLNGHPKELRSRTRIRKLASTKNSNSQATTIIRVQSIEEKHIIQVLQWHRSTPDSSFHQA
jgi:hypothetical protein